MAVLLQEQCHPNLISTPSVTLYAFDIVEALLQGRLSGAQMGWSQRQGGQCGSSVDGSGQCGGPDGPRERVQAA